MDRLDTKILLVEDEPTLQIVFQMQLKKLGCKASGVADNGLVAVRKALEEPYHLIFMDVRLPGIDGIAATKRIREGEVGLGRRSVIIGLTAFAHRELCLDAGMDDFIQKPVLLEQMQAMLEKWVFNAAVLNVAPAIDHSASRELQPIAERGAKLQAIQEKITRLRKSVGLE